MTEWKNVEVTSEFSMADAKRKWGELTKGKESRIYDQIILMRSPLMYRIRGAIRQQSLFEPRIVKDRRPVEHVLFEESLPTDVTIDELEAVVATMREVIDEDEGAEKVWIDICKEYDQTTFSVEANYGTEEYERPENVHEIVKRLLPLFKEKATAEQAIRYGAMRMGGRSSQRRLILMKEVLGE